MTPSEWIRRTNGATQEECDEWFEEARRFYRAGELPPRNDGTLSVCRCPACEKPVVMERIDGFDRWFCRGCGHIGSGEYAMISLVAHAYGCQCMACRSSWPPLRTPVTPTAT